MSDNNIIFISLPVSFKYIVLTHDILNYIKIRKSEQLVEEKQSKSLISKFYTDVECTENFSQDCDYDTIEGNESINREIIGGLQHMSIDENDKENLQMNGQITSNQNCIKNKSKEMNYNRQLNFDLISKIEDVENVLNFFNCLEDY
jgi:hypothetical protein